MHTRAHVALSSYALMHTMALRHAPRTIRGLCNHGVFPLLRFFEVRCRPRLLWLAKLREQDAPGASVWAASVVYTAAVNMARPLPPSVRWVHVLQGGCGAALPFLRLLLVVEFLYRQLIQMSRTPARMTLRCAITA